MNMKKTVLLGVALLFGTACAYAVTADEVAAAAEQAALARPYEPGAGRI